MESTERRAEALGLTVVPTSRGTRIAVIVAAVFLLAVFGAMAWAAVAMAGPSPGLVASLAALSLLVAAAAVAGVLEAFKTRVLLGDGVVEVSGALGRRRLRREDIEGLRSNKGTLVLIPLRRGLRRIALSDPAQVEAVRGWLGPSCQDIDARDMRAAQAALENTPELGATPAARTKRIKRGRSIVYALSGAAVVLTLWAGVFPLPYRLVVIAVATLVPIAVVVAVVFRETVCLVPQRFDARAPLFVVWFFPPLALAARAQSDYSVVETGPLWAAAVVGGLAVCVVFVLADHNLRVKPLLLLLVAPVAALYAFAVVSLGNVLLDRSPSKPFVATVIDKYVTRGKGASHNVTVAPWGPIRSDTTHSVSRALYDQVAVSQTVTAQLHAGAFGIHWYRVGRPICPPGTSAVGLPKKAPERLQSLPEDPSPR